MNDIPFLLALADITSEGWTITFEPRPTPDVTVSRYVRGYRGAPYSCAVGRAQAPTFPTALDLAYARAQSAADSLEVSAPSSEPNELLSLLGLGKPTASPASKTRR